MAKYKGDSMEYMIAEAVNYIKNIFQNDFSGHDYFHTLRVYRIARTIAEQENADMQIVSLAAFLHDVDDRKLSPETYEKKEHAISFLKEQHVSDENIERICQIIDEVSFAGNDSVIPSTIEGKCVQDADRLDALGAIGIARAFAYGGNHHRAIYDPEIVPKIGMIKEEYQGHVTTSVNHFYEKLFLLKDMMNTDIGKKIAEKRERFMRAYVDEFMAEWDGKDY